MLASILIMLREGLEAALIVGIVLGYLKQSGRLHLRAAAWAGVGLAAVLSLLVALGLTLASTELAGRAEELFEGTTMVLAAVVLTWMIFWMRRQGRFLKRDLEREMARTISGGASLGILSLTFLAVFREGVESALFLTATVFASSSWEVVVGSVIGLAIAVGIGWALYTTAVRLDVRRFFDVTSVLLILFAAGLIAHGVHEFNEAGVVPVVVEHLWDSSRLLSAQSLAGELLKTLFGYNPAPSLTEVAAYLVYILAVVGGIYRWSREGTTAERRTA